MIGLDAEIDMSEVPEAVNGEACPGQQGEGEGELANDEDAAKAVLAGAGSASTAFLEGFSGIYSRRVPGGR